MDISRLVEEHGPRVWALCRRLDPQPEDAYQELWAKLLTAEFDPAGPATFRTWLTTVTHRHLVDRHRRRLTRQRRHVDEDVHDEAFAASEPAPDTSMCQSATPAQLEAALAALPEAHRRIVVLHHLEELPLPEIALIEGVPVGTLKPRLHRARAALARSLA